MPRKNNHVKHLPFSFQNNNKNKRRFKSQQAAEKAAELQMLIVPGLELTVYAADGGWYLTRNTK